MILRPVLAPFASGEGGGREAVEEGRRAGRLCLELAAREAGVRGGGFPKDPEGAPLPIEGKGGTQHHWSVTNTPGLSAAVLGPCPVGIDAESLDRPRIAPLSGFADGEEAAVLGAEDEEARLLLWTAKEAVLKLTGVGIADLRRWRLVARTEAELGGLVLEKDGTRHAPVHVRQGRHLVAVACGDPAFTVEPLVLRAEARR